MDLDTISVDDFKAFFRRDFPYLPVYDNTKTYSADAVVFYTNEIFYKCLVTPTVGVAPPSDATKWEITTDDQDNYIADADISKAFLEAQANLNQALFADDAQVRMGYLYMTAHYLVHDIRTSMQGVASRGDFPMNSRTVGSVSESYTIPDKYMKDPVLSFYTSSGYGMKLLSLVIPALRGNVGSVQGWTTP